MLMSNKSGHIKDRGLENEDNCIHLGGGRVVNGEGGGGLSP